MCPWPRGRCAEAKSRRVVGGRQEGCFELGNERVSAGLSGGHRVTVLCAGHSLAAADSTA